MNKKITFPHMGDYYIPISYLIKKITKCEVIIPPFITRKTIEIGSKYSPDFVCVPFKYNLGNFIESLNMGANVILQAGGGCRYGYYAELQEEILRNLGYDFEFVNFIKDNHVSIINIYKYAKKINKKLNIFKYFYYLINTITMIIIMDSLGKNIRENMGFEVEKGSFKKIQNEFFEEIKGKIGFIKLIKIYFKYKKKYNNCKINKPKNHLKVAIVGELYSIMEPFCSYNIETKLANMGIEVKRFTTLTYLLIVKKFKLPHLLKKGKKYLKYHLGADATESVVLSYQLAQEGYDGIIHIKSFGCTPEINAMPILAKVSEDYGMPIIYFSFDAQDNEVGVDTRLEAFYDMILDKKNK